MLAPKLFASRNHVLTQKRSLDVLFEKRWCSDKSFGASLPVAKKKDLIGPPNPISNLRPIIFHIPKNESVYEKRFRENRQQVQEWNEKFWTNHNRNFFCEREAFSKKLMLQKENASLNCKDTEEISLSAEEMSIFYKKFLDAHWKVHLNYNLQWYKKNVYLAYLACLVNMHNLFHRR